MCGVSHTVLLAEVVLVNVRDGGQTWTLSHHRDNVIEHEPATTRNIGEADVGVTQHARPACLFVAIGNLDGGIVGPVRQNRLVIKHGASSLRPTAHRPPNRPRSARVLSTALYCL